MRRVMSFSWRKRFRMIKMDKAIGIGTGVGIFVAALVMLGIGVACIQDRHYFLALVTLYLFVAVAKVGVEFFSEMRNQEFDSRMTDSNQSSEQESWRDRETGEVDSKSKGVDLLDEDEDESEGEGWKEEYKPIASQAIDPKKKRKLKGGELGYKPLEELDLSPLALNCLDDILSAPISCAQVRNTKRGRVIYGDGELGYKPVAELDLPQAALNVLVAIFPYPEPE